MDDNGCDDSRCWYYCNRFPPPSISNYRSYRQQTCRVSSSTSQTLYREHWRASMLFTSSCRKVLLFWALKAYVTNLSTHHLSAYELIHLLMNSSICLWTHQLIINLLMNSSICLWTHQLIIHLLMNLSTHYCPLILALKATYISDKKCWSTTISTECFDK